MYYSKEPELTGRIVTPEDPQYNVDRQDFNTFFDKFPLVIVYAQETQERSQCCEMGTLLEGTDAYTLWRS